jgi:bifunctional DNA-binding transcriptional regulator/antitoxin component of YhaV-PrlF toxin-antitoxin module
MYNILHLTLRQMSKNISNDIVIRDKRQITLPRRLCEQLGVEPGDKLTLYVEGEKLVAEPKKTVALKALEELRRIFEESEVPEQELLKTARQIRHKLVKKQYGRRG